MKIIIDILHPAHVHFFRNFITRMEADGHEILATARDKEVTIELLDHYGIRYELLSKQQSGIRLGLELLVRVWRLWLISLRFKPDCYMGVMGPVISVVGAITGTPCYVFYDTEHAKVTNRFAYKLATRVITPHSYNEDIGAKHVRYRGTHELAYLAPDYFTPDPAIREKLGVATGERIFLLRFIAWAASHDVGHKGLSLEEKREIADLLAANGRLLISSESPLPQEFEPYRITVPAQEMMSLLAIADLYIGEGATMAEEAAVLGTPSIYINTLHAGIIDDLIAHDLLTQIDPLTSADCGAEVLQHLRELLAIEDLKAVTVARKNAFLADKDDVTAWMVNFITEQINARP